MRNNRSSCIDDVLFQKVDGKPVTLVVDSWSSKGGTMCLTAIVCYFVNDKWQMEGRLLAAKKTSGRHTAANLAKLIKKVSYHIFDFTDVLLTIKLIALS